MIWNRSLPSYSGMAFSWVSKWGSGYSAVLYMQQSVAYATRECKTAAYQTNRPVRTKHLKDIWIYDIITLMKCVLCPRHCNADREKTYGVCASGLTPRVARVSLHHWEEPCISGENGSGTVFFTGCSLHCVYCQNQKISKIPAEGGPDLLPGKEADTAELIRMLISGPLGTGVAVHFRICNHFC